LNENKDHEKSLQIDGLPEDKTYVNGLLTYNAKQLCLISTEMRHHYHKNEANIYKARIEQKLGTEKSFFL